MSRRTLTAMGEGGMSALVACFFILAGPSPARASEILPLLTPLQELRDRLSTLEFLEEAAIDDRREPGGLRSFRTRRRILFSRREGKVRVEPADGRPRKPPPQRPGLSRSATGVTIRSQGFPEPVWLFDCLAALERQPATARRGTDGAIVVDAYLELPSGRVRTRRVTFSSDRLPVRIRTYGPRGTVLDDIAVTWRRAGLYAFPSHATMVLRSRRNTVRAEIRYTEVRADGAMSATVFDSP